MVSEERCVCCGEIIPEGRHICAACMGRAAVEKLPERDIPRSPKRESMVIGYRYRCAQCGDEVSWREDR